MACDAWLKKSNQEKQIMNKKNILRIKLIFWVINISLAALIIWVMWNKFYSKEIIVDLKQGEKPGKLLEIIDRYFQKQEKKDISLVCIFNRLPALNDIEVINKLVQIHSDRTNFFVFFHKNFQTSSKLNFPYRFLTNIKLFGKLEDKVLSSNYFLLLQNQETQFIDTSMKILDINFLIEKYLYPHKEYSDFAVSKERLKKRLMDNLNEGNKTLLNLLNDNVEKFVGFKGYSKIYFIVADCSDCELKALIQEMKLEQILDAKKNLVIFPIHAEESRLKGIIEKSGISLPIFIDYKNEFNLLSVITSNKTKLICIEEKDMEVLN